MSASAKKPTARKPAWCNPARCARRSARPPRRCFSPRATSTTPPRRRRRASRAKIPAINIRASPIRPSTCSSGAWRRSKAPKPRAPPRPAWPRSRLSLVGQLKAGDHVVASKAMFGSCRYVVEDYLPRFGVASTLVDGCNLDAWRNAVRPNTKTFFLESPTNPALEVIDIAEVAKIAHAAGATLVVDNVFATPLFQSPLALGADCVVYSATKHIDGQGRCLGGVVLGSQKFIMDKIHVLLRQTGPSMSPFNAWVLLKGLETLAVRVRRQTDSAATLAVALAEHPKISRLIYPGRPDHPQAAVAQKQMRGGSTLVAFEIKGGKNGRVPLPGRAQARPHQQQSRRRQEPDHPSGDDDAPAAHPGAARRARHQRRAGARLGRPRTSRRYRGGRARRARGGIDHVVTVRL